MPGWKPGARKEFTTAAVKKWLRKGVGQVGWNRNDNRWVRKAFVKHMPWKMSFFLWRMWKWKIPTDEVVRRFGVNMVSKCECCLVHEVSSLQHIFCKGEIAQKVWGFFAQTMGINLSMVGVRSVCWSWWNSRNKNRLLNFLAMRIPVAVVWELWVEYTASRYGGERGSANRVIFRVTKDLVDSIRRRWPSWDGFPPNWHFVMRKAADFGCERITVRRSWTKPPKGWIKINCAICRERRCCSFFGRNSRGLFVFAGVFTADEAKEVPVQEMLQECWAWCRRKKLKYIIIEAEEILGVNVPDDMVVKLAYCDKRVNCIAGCLAEKCKGKNVNFKGVGGLPKAFMQLLRLEGIPHFLFAPGGDFVW